MSTYVFMRVLESAPRRYDLGMRLLTFGRVDRAYDELASRVQPGQRVLDIGCGTGALTCRVARRGANVRGIDINAEMLAVARRRVSDQGLQDRVELVQAGVAELDREADAAYDAVVSGLCLSELSADETAYALAHTARILRPGGLLLVADEVRPPSLPLRVLAALARIPLAVLTYVLTQQTSHAVFDLPERIRSAGMRLAAQRAGGLGTFAIFVARKPGGGAS